MSTTQTDKKVRARKGKSLILAFNAKKSCRKSGENYQEIESQTSTLPMMCQR